MRHTFLQIKSLLKWDLVEELIFTWSLYSLANPWENISLCSPPCPRLNTVSRCPGSGPVWRTSWVNTTGPDDPQPLPPSTNHLWGLQSDSCCWEHVALWRLNIQSVNNTNIKDDVHSSSVAWSFTGSWGSCSQSQQWLQPGQFPCPITGPLVGITINLIPNQWNWREC